MYTLHILEGFAGHVDCVGSKFLIMTDTLSSSRSGMLVACSLFSTFSFIELLLSAVIIAITMSPLFRFLLGIALVSTTSSVSNIAVEASNFSKPHAHTGKVEPFTPGDPKIKLDGKATSILKAGKPYQVS